MINRRKTDTLEHWQIVNGCCQREKDNLKAINTDLLAALEAILNVEGPAMFSEASPGMDIPWHFAKVRAAIAKAKGE